MAAMVWRACRQMNVAEARLYSCLSCWKARKWKPCCSKKNLALPVPSANQILAASPRRIEARCPYFHHCGGCHYQHTSYEHQLEIKAAILKENLRRIAKLELDTELNIHPSPPWNYRNRTRLRLHSAPEFALGYYKLNSHELLPVEQCPISSPLINRAITAMWDLGRAGRVPDGIREIEFFANADDTQLLAEVYWLRKSRTRRKNSPQTSRLRCRRLAGSYFSRFAAPRWNPGRCTTTRRQRS